MSTRARIARIVAAGAAAVGLVLGGMVFADSASAASLAVTITPATTTVPSGTSTTYTLNINCSGTPAGCGTSTVTFPTTGAALTGDGATTDFGSWVANSTCPTLTKAGGVVTIDVTSYIGTTNAAQQCLFTVRSPDYTTLPGTVATITPTLTTANGGTTTGSAVSLTPTSAHNSGFVANAPGQVVPGGTMSYSLFFKCSASGSHVGDVGSNPITLTAQLPANFTYTGHTTGFSGTFTAPPVGSQGGTFTYVGSYADCNGISGTATGFTLAITGTATDVNGPDAANTTVCATTSASWTYLDDTTPTSSAVTTPCTTVNPINTSASKAASTTSPLGNNGQFTFGATSPLYTFPGNWDGTGAGSSWTISFSTIPVPSATAGVSYGVRDPLPCLTGGPQAGIYASLAPGATCATPGFVPTAVTPSGFAPAAGATITLLYADGTSGTAAFAGGKWTIPTTKAVSEIDFPPFAEQGSNTFATMSYKIDGYAAASTAPGTELQNTATVTSYSSTDLATPLAGVAVRTPSTVLGVADPTTVSVRPNVTQGTVTNCSTAYGLGNTSGRQNLIQFAQGTSQALYYDFLMPPDATYTGAATSVFRLTNASHTYTSSAVTPTQTPDYNGTGRTLVQWIIPAGLAQVPGTYQLSSTTGFAVQLPAGCSGTYQADITLGYGGPTQVWCAVASGAVRAPLNPSATSALTSNGTPTANNYCGYSAPLSVAPFNPGFSIDKAVKGDLDATTVNGGGIGKVSPTNGAATYTVTFKNTGMSNLHDPVIYDVLPRTGDDRGSQFDVTLGNVPAPAAGITIQYATAANPCRPELLQANPGCTANAFSSTAPSPLSAATALRISYSGTVGVAGSPFPQTVSASFAVKTPNVTNGDVAWNTAVTNAHTGDTGDPTATDDLMSALASSKTGVTASDGVPQIVKSSSTPSYSAVGNTISYTFQVTNNAAATINSLTLTDGFTDAPAGATPPTVTCPVTTLAAGASTTCTATYTVTQDDIDNGRLSDVATATGTSAAGGTISNTSNGVTVPALAAPAITLTKSASPNSVTGAGDTVAYSFLVRNTGNQTVHGLTIADVKVAGVSCPVTTLAPSASTTCTAGYTVTQADMDAGSILNTATATAFDPTGAARTATSSATVTAPAAAHLTLTKSASPTSVGVVGEVIAYGFHVVNDGTVTLTGVTVDDPMLPGVSCPATDLAPTDTEDCTGSYTVTQADLDAGTITNTATASGTSPAGANITATSSAAVTVAQNAVLTLVETVDQPTATAAGQVLHYTFHVVNTGNVTVSGVAVQETGFTGTGGVPTVTCPAASLAPGDTMDCTASYAVAVADLALARIDNPASVTGVSAGGSVPPATSTTQVTVDPPASPIPPTATAAVLAATGVANVVYGIVSAAGLLVMGLVLLVLRRRRRDA